MACSIEEKVAFLRSLPAIRERCGKVHALAQEGKLQYFDYHPEKEEAVVEYCSKIIRRDYNDKLESIPPHGRWRHLDAGHSRIDPLVTRWRCQTSSSSSSSCAAPDDKEMAKRLLDLFLVSVLLDAGAGSVWSFVEPGTGEVYKRSEGLGVASFHMFDQGFFSGNMAQPHQVDADGLSRMTPENTGFAMQVSNMNPMTGLKGRANLLSRLASALRSNPVYFGKSGRPGNLIDYLESQSTVTDGTRSVHVSLLWRALMDGLQTIWPASRISLGGIPLGDVWPCSALAAAATTGTGTTTTPSDSSLDEDNTLVPFHKLTGWLAYSLIEPLQKVLKWNITGIEDMTGLPEYRNGGLLIDFGVLSLRTGAISPSYYPDSSSSIPKLPPQHPAIVEWRAMTVIELDRIAEGIRKVLGYPLTLAQILESATWKGGRAIAAEKRPQTGGGPPIEIESDGTVF